MKQRYPIGRQHFETIREEGAVYVDKTALIYELTHNYNYVFLARPRRFGKSLLLSTIQAYFEGKKELFHDLEILNLENNWKKFPVIYLELSRIESNNDKSLSSSLESQFILLEKEYGIETSGLQLAQRFEQIIIAAYKYTGEKVVILIDEYDNPLINTLDKPENHNKNRILLKALYSNLKALDQYIRFAMLSGVSRFSNTSIFSGINNIEDITFNPKFSSICGFTREEICKFLWPGVEALSEKMKCSP